MKNPKKPKELNFAYKLKAVLRGTTFMSKEAIMDTIYCFLHPIETYESESTYFFDSMNGCRDLYPAWILAGMVPSALVYGLFGDFCRVLREGA